MGTVFAACVVIVTAGVIWFHIVRPILADFGVIGMDEGNASTVKHSQIVMSPPAPPVPPDKQTDEPDRRADAALSGDPKRCPALQLDRTKAGLIAILVYNEWTVSEIRNLLKGDNTVISQEVADARQRLGLEPPTAYRTPIAGRPTDVRLYVEPRPVFRETDPDLAYQPPE